MVHSDRSGRTSSFRTSDDRFDVGSDVKAKAKDLARADAHARLTQIKYATAEVLSTSQAILRKERRGNRPVTASDAAAWERLRGVVDAGIDGGKDGWIVAQQRLVDAAADGDQAILESARLMLRDHLVARRQTTLPSVDDLDGLSSDPDVRTAMAFDIELRKSGAWVQQAVEHALYEVEPGVHGGHDAMLLPTFDGQTIHVPDPRTGGVPQPDRDRVATLARSSFQDGPQA